jgi:hypothetical protein
MEMDIIRATRDYEGWLASQTPIVATDLRLKHRRMDESPFVLLRGTFYRWLQHWTALDDDAIDAPRVLSVGDLHVENFGTWRDIEGRLIWGVNDFDEVCTLPYTHDLVRLATSASLAVRASHFSLSIRTVCEAIVEGYRASMERGGRAIVLAERRRWLRKLALGKLRDPIPYWQRLTSLPIATEAAPHAALKATMPARGISYRVHRRTAGVGSLGRRRFVAIGEWDGGLIAREAKAWAPSAAVWAGVDMRERTGADLAARAVRAPDPFFAIQRPWIVRRLAPDCSRIELVELPKEHSERKLLRAMGWETANMHARDPRRGAVLRDMAGRKAGWLERAARKMMDATIADWRRWKRA